MNNENFEGLLAVSPEMTLVLFALGALVLDLVKKGRDSRLVGYLTLIGLAICAWQLIGQFGDESKTVLGLVLVDSFGRFFKLFSVAAVAVVVVFVMNDRRERKHGIGEYYFLLLGATIGIFFMVGTSNLLLLMLGLELLSLASYALAGFHKGDRKSAEAAMKYVVFGGLSAGLMLYGISLLYGLSGTLDLIEMGTMESGLATQMTTNPVPVAVAVVMVLAGFAYKISVVPFHFWAPDVYEGAPTPVTTFLAVASKAAGFGALLRFLDALFMDADVQEAIAAYGERIGLLIAIMAAVTMTIGNLGALRQTDLKRLLAYSSIAHAGYLLIGVATMNTAGFEASLFYLAAYYFMNLGAFGVVLYFEGVTGKTTVDSIKGFGPKAPLVSVVMIVFLVSLTGLPPTVGFYGKYRLFVEGMNSGLGWLVIVAALNSVVSLFYYFRIGKALFLADPAETTPKPQPAFVGFLAVISVLTVAAMLYAEPLEAWAKSSLG